MTQDEITTEIRIKVFELKHNTCCYDREMILYIDKGSYKEVTRHIPLVQDGTVKLNTLFGMKYYFVESKRPHINVTYKD